MVINGERAATAMQAQCSYRPRAVHGTQFWWANSQSTSVKWSKGPQVPGHLTTQWYARLLPPAHSASTSCWGDTERPEVLQLFCGESRWLRYVLLGSLPRALGQGERENPELGALQHLPGPYLRGGGGGMVTPLEF